MFYNIYNIYTKTACSILLATGVAKLVSAFGVQPLLKQIDPVIGIQYRYLMIFVGVVELVAVILCLCSSSIRRRNEIIFCLACCFAAYRICLLAINQPPLCHCLGTFGEVLNIPAWLEHVLMLLSLLYLFVGSGTFFCAQVYSRFVRTARQPYEPYM